MIGSISVGDIVSLRSGGPNMTVSSIEGDAILCDWIDSKGMPRQRSYRLGMLQHGSSRHVMVMPHCPECKRLRPANLRVPEASESSN
ncbi:DUF2158 domain-containing protein [Thalassococcus sp. S3]|uniref:DUF2158 domain-containing protein n=1 Tax=Thalassococcus sp. S3 TaxID=2017482 RepID=UPI0013EE57E5